LSRPWPGAGAGRGAPNQVRSDFLALWNSFRPSFSRQTFQASTPCLRILRCASLALLLLDRGEAILCLCGLIMGHLDHSFLSQWAGRFRCGGSLVQASPRAASICSCRRFFTSWRSAPLRSASLRPTPCRFAPIRFVRIRFASVRAANLRSASLRFALLRFGSRVCKVGGQALDTYFASLHSRGTSLVHLLREFA